MNQTQLAALLGITEAAIRMAIRDGRLDPPSADGVWNRVAAVKQFRANTQRTLGKPGPRLGTHTRPRRPPAAASSIIAVPTNGRGVTDDVTPEAIARAEAELRAVMATHGEGLPADRPIGIGNSRRIQELLKAERLSLEIQRLRGESISTRSALLTVELFHRELRDDWLSIPGNECDTMADALACEPGAAKRELERICRAHAQRVAERAFQLGDEVPDE